MHQGEGDRPGAPGPTATVPGVPTPTWSRLQPTYIGLRVHACGPPVTSRSGSLDRRHRRARSPPTRSARLPPATSGQPPGAAAAGSRRRPACRCCRSEPGDDADGVLCGEREPAPGVRQGRRGRHRPNLGRVSGFDPSRRAPQMRRSPDADGPARFLASGHDHPAHRDADHRRRPGRPLHRLPPAAARAPLPDRRRQRAHRRQLATAVGHPEALQPGQVRRPARAAFPAAAVVVPRQGRGRRLPREATRCTPTSRCG